MKFKPMDKKIEIIFSGKNTYTIPNFQRDYSWGNEQYEDFIKDIFKSSKIKYEDDSHAINIPETPNDYFFGTFILVGDEANPDVEKPYIVVDGQQRLTTMTLFFSAIKNIIESKDKDYKHVYNDALLAKNTSEGKEKELPRLVNRQLNPVLPVNILNLNNLSEGGGDCSVESESQESLMTAYKHIKTCLGINKITSYIDNSKNFNLTDKEYIKVLECIGKQLLNSTAIGIYTIDETSANIIYKNFNARGLSLSRIDLIKNELFEVLDDQSEFVVTKWNKILSNIYEIGNSSVREFVIHYMDSKGWKANKNNIFNKFESKVTKDKHSYISFIKELEKNSKFYRVICAPKDTDCLFGVSEYFKQKNYFILKYLLELLNDINAKQCRVFILSAFRSREANKISDKHLLKLIKILTLHQILHVLATTPGNKLTAIYKKFANELNCDNLDNNSVGDLITSFNKEFINIFPEQVNIYKSKVVYGSESKVIKFILATLAIAHDNNINSSNQGLRLFYDASLEHVVDRKTTSLSNIDKLGNLTLLEQAIHRNDIDKSTMYSQSLIKMTQDLVKDPKNKVLFSVSEYNKNDVIERINDRNEEILNEFYEYVRKQN
ncbi:DUF262 domain-containing protein [Aerococcaceae bacterium NML130460]|nr:DUF262 domain-containing protein [Aerococcaceae bacterium NML130460]